MKSLPLLHARASDPTSAYGLAFRVADRFGVVTVFAGILLAFLWSQERAYHVEAQSREGALVRSLDANTAALESLSERVAALIYSKGDHP